MLRTLVTNDRARLGFQMHILSVSPCVLSALSDRLCTHKFVPHHRTRFGFQMHILLVPICIGIGWSCRTAFHQTTRTSLTLSRLVREHLMTFLSGSIS